MLKDENGLLKNRISAMGKKQSDFMIRGSHKNKSIDIVG